MKKQLLILGSGSQARYVIETVARTQAYQIVGVLDLETAHNVGKRINGIPVIGTLEDLSQKYPPQAGEVIVAYGNNRRKKQLVEHLGAQGYRFATIVSPDAYIAESAQLKEGVIINPQAVVMPNAVIGAHVIIHSQSVVEHDCYVSDFVNIAPGVSFGGNVFVGEGSYLYTGSTVIPKIRIGQWVVVGAGAVVIRDVPDYATVVGVPARVIKTSMDLGIDDDESQKGSS